MKNLKYSKHSMSRLKQRDIPFFQIDDVMNDPDKMKKLDKRIWYQKKMDMGVLSVITSLNKIVITSYWNNDGFR